MTWNQVEDGGAFPVAKSLMNILGVMKRLAVTAYVKACKELQPSGSEFPLMKQKIYFCIKHLASRLFSRGLQIWPTCAFCARLPVI